MAPALLLRDVIKLCRGLVYEAVARLFIVKREAGTWIHCSARLDILPISKDSAPYRFYMRKDSYVEARCTVNAWHGDVTFGEDCGIGIGSIVIGPVDIGAKSAIAQHCFVSGINHRFDDVSQSYQSQGFTVKKVTIGENVWIGANCAILPGVEIGSNSVIGAGSVVTKDIPPYHIAVGNPARLVKKFDSQKGTWIKL
jgi:acetyltransferase-like isoleucine patch superfamily enzyme